MEFEFLGEVSGKSEKPSTTKPNDSGIEFEFLDKATEQPSGFLRQAADIPIQFAKGMGTGTRGITDVIGADNPVSKMIAGYEDYMDTLLSAESRNDSKRVAQMLQEAKDGGFLDKISAGFEAFASAPLETTANVAGYMVPQLAIGIVGKAAQLGKAAQVGLTLGTGFAQGVGTAKGNIYQNTKEYLREQGVAEDKIEPIAVKAQSYNGENLDQLLLSGGLNALAASTGAEAILTRVLTKQGKEVSGEAVAKILKGVGVNEKTAKSIAPVIAGGGKGIVAEAPIESVQGIQEKTAENIPLQRLGYDVPTFQGAIESATTGVVAGGFVGGLAGGVEALSPEQKEQRDIDKEAERRARDLEATDPATQAISTELTRLERGIDNKRMDLDALESTSPEASKMRLDIAEDQKNLAVLKEQANKLGLSETITEAEKQQIELAKAITTPKPLPTDVLPTETPGATYGREEQIYDVFGGITRKPVSIPKPAELPAAPTIEEQTAEKTYGGETGVFDVFAGARRKPVVTEEPPVSMVGKQVIPGVTPVPVVEKAPTEPTVNQSLTVAPEAPAITPAPIEEVAPAISDETKRIEQIAIQSVDTPKKLNARLQDALDTYGVKNRKSWTIDFENKQLISPDKTTAIKWTTRNNPNEPESYTNQQTSTGKAKLVKYQPSPVAETPAVAPAAKQALPKAIIQRLLKDGVEIIPSGNQYSGFRQLVMEKLGKPSPKSKSGTNAVKKELIQYLGVDTNDTIAGIDNSIRSKLRQMLENITAPTPAVSETITPAAEVAPATQVEQEIEVGDEASVNLAGRNETVTIARIEDINGVPTAYFDYFGYKSRPLSEMQLAKKSKQNIAKAKAKEKVSQIEIEKPKPEDFFSNKEISSLASGKAPDGWKFNFKSRDEFPLMDKQGKRWTFEPQYINGKIASILMRAEGQYTGVTIESTLTPAISETKTPAAEVAPIERDVTKLEQLTPKEFQSETLFAKKARQAAKIWGKLAILFDRVGREIKSNQLSSDNIYPSSQHDGPQKMFEIANLSKEDMSNYDKAITIIRWAEGDVAGEFRERSESYKELIDSEADRIRNEIKLYQDIPVDERTNEADAEIKKRLDEEIDDVAAASGFRQESERDIIRALKYAEEVNKIKEDLVRLGKPVFYNRTEYVVSEIDAPIDDYFKALKKAIRQKKPISAAASDYYSIALLNLPEGYTKQGELYVYQPEDTRKTVVGDTQYQTEGVIPEDQRFTEDELRVIVNDIFGGKIPDKIEIITDATDPNKEFKAAYSIRRGTITYNLAYLAKGDDLRFVTNHELGHFILGDPKFQKEMARLFDTLPTDIQEKLKKAIDEAYAQEGLGVRAEETIVFAFGEILENAPDGRNILQRFLDAIRDAINRLFKTEGYIPRNPKQAAAAILLAARNKFERGEFIRRPNGSIVNIAPDIRRMAVERKQVMSQNLGGLKDTPKNIIAKTKELLRERVFNPSEVTEQNTTEAFRALGKLLGNKQERRDFADELNDIATIVDDTGAAAEVSMGAALFANDLFEYAVRLAAQGQKMMLGIMMTNINNLPTGTEGRTGAGQALRAAREMRDTFLTMAKAEQNAFINYAAEFVYGPNPTKEQVDSIRKGYDAVEEVEEPTEEDLGEELDKTGIQIGVDLVKKIEDDVKNAVAPERDPIVAAMLALQKLGGGTIETKYLPYSKRTSKIKEGVRNILQGGLSNYRQKMVEGAATGLETGFWKTLSNEENKPGSLGELDAAQNRELGNIVKSMLISLGLKGEPPNTKMSIYEQVASILGERPLSTDKIKLADENIRAEIKRKREKELDATEDSDKQDAINVKYDGIESAWDKAMAQQLDMPISESTMRRLIFNELKEENTSIAKLTKLMNEEPAIATSRQDRLVNAIIEKIAGVTFEGQNPADYSTLKEYLSNQLDGLIQERQIKEAATKAKAKIAKEAKSSVELQAEKAENEAQAQIEKLAKIQSDTPSFEVKLPAEAQMNPVREAVKRALKLNINRMFDPKQSGEIIANFKKSFVKELKELGVEDTAAGILADVVSRQIEINSMNNELKSIDRAIEKGPISEIIKAIKETPLEEQRKPNWRYEVMRDYLRKAGLPLAQAERIAKLMDISLQKRLTQAKEQAFTDAISKTAPWKAGNVRSKRAFQQVIQAIRAGALDPSRNMASDIAALNGWTGFTADQYKNLLKFDTILADEKTGELEKANAYKGVQDIISKSKLPIRARDVIAQYYDAQALNGIPTFSVNSFSPIAFAMRNAIIEAGAGTLKGDPKAIGKASKIFVDSIKSWANTVAFSFKNNVTVYSNVDYIVNDDNLLRLYRRGVDQFQKGNTPREKADGIKNIMIGMMDYVRRVLNALDYGAIAALQNQNVGKYAMAVMKRNNISEKKANEVFAAMMKEKNDFYLNQIAIGTDKNKARILADEYYVASWGKALEKAGIGAEKIKSAMDSAINDAMSSVGRNRQSLDAFKEEATNMRDAGLASAPALWLLESIANAANQSNSQVTKLFARMIYGFAIVPARVIRETAWFSPYGLVRLAVDAGMRNRNMDSRYAQSLGNEFQRQQRLNEAVAGTVALVALLALRAGSTDDPEDEDAFKIVFTGNGPKRNDDPQFHDSWYKAGNKPNSMIVSFGKTKIPLNMMRGFEAFTWPAMMLGALDDLEIRKKQKQQTNTPAEIEDAAIVAGFVFDAALRRGPYAFTTKSLFGTYGDIGVEGVAKGLTFPAKTLIPVLGTSLASNLSNFLNDPIDRRTLDGAVWSNIPFIGPAVAPKALNAFGEPALSTDLASKMFKLGVPIVYDIPTDRESIKLHELVLKQGGGPSIPTRNQLAQRLDREPTNKEYEMFVKEYGTVLTNSMKKNYDRLFNAKAEFYSKAVERIGNRARDIAENKVRQAAKKP